MIALARPPASATRIRLRRLLTGGDPARPGLRPLEGTGQAAALAHDDGIDLLVTGIGGGKSLVAAIKLLSWIQRHPRRANGLPTEWFALAHELRGVVGGVFKKLVEAETFFGPPGCLIEQVLPGLADPRIRMRNGAIIHGRSAGHGVDPESFKVFEVDGVWADEGSKLNELAFVGALARVRSSDAIRAVITTNPKPGWIWRMVNGVAPTSTGDRSTDATIEVYRRILEHVDIRVHRWDTRRNTTNRSRVLDGLSALMEAASPDLSRQEVDGLFLGTEIASAVFPGMEAAFADETTCDDPVAVVGVDLGARHDWTWFVALTASGVVVDVERFQQSTVDVPGSRFWSHAADRLFDFCARNRAPRVCADASMAEKWFGLVQNDPRARGLKMDGLLMGGRGSNKTVYFRGLRTAFGSSSLTIPRVVRRRGALVEVPHVSILRRELAEMEVSSTAAGNEKWDHPSGGHDDGPMALALAWHGLTTIPRRAIPANLNRWMAQPGLGGRR